MNIKKEADRKKKSESKTKEGMVWKLSNNHRVRISHDVGHFTVNFDDHIEKLEIFNLGTNWIEMTNSVPINSIYSQFYAYFQFIQQQKAQIDKEIVINPKYKKLNDVSIGYLFETTGPTKYEIRLVSPALLSCYQYTIYDLLTQNPSKPKESQSDEIMMNIFANTPPISGEDEQTYIKASSAYFRPQPNEVTVDELQSETLIDEPIDIGNNTDIDNNRNCELRRVIGSGIIIQAESPSTSCEFPANLARIIEEEELYGDDEDEQDKESYIVLTDRGECTFYDKVNTIYKNNRDSDKLNIEGVIVGNVVETSNGNIFTMGSDGTEKEIDLTSFMINKLSYNALSKCAKYNQNNNMKIELIEVLTRCEQETITELNIHGINSHFFVSSHSQSGFVVTQNKEIFTLSLPQ